MKLDAINFGLACAAAFSLMWVILGLFMMAAPMHLMQIPGGGQGEFSSMHQGMGVTGWFMGLILWTVLAGLTGWLTAFIYNKLL